jgi:hypothetical protein
MPAAPITVSFRPNMRDLFSPLFFINLKKLWFLTIGLPVVFLLNLTLNGRGQTDGVPAGLIFAGVLWVMITFGPYLGARATMKQPNYGSDIRYTFSESGIDVVAKHSDTHLDWTLVTRAIETGSSLVLIVSRATLVIPEKAVSPSDLGPLKELIRASVKGKVKLKR